MKKTNLHITRMPSYPGEYAVIKMLSGAPVKHEKVNTMFEKGPPVNIKETNEVFVVEVAIPGFLRENLSVFLKGNDLFISARPHLNEDCNRFHSHEFEHEVVKRRIPLPNAADTSIVSAEYKNGILTIHIPKSDAATKAPHTRIVVY